MDQKALKKELSNAYDLIQQDELDDALEILNPILEEHPDNADAWWLKANASSDPTVVREALVNTLIARPGDPKANEMLEMLNDAYPPTSQEDLRIMERLLDAEQEQGFDPLMDIDNALGDEAPDEDEFFLDESKDPFAELLDDSPEDDSGAKKKKKKRREKKESTGSSSIRRIALILIVLVLVVAALAVVLGNGDNNDTVDEEGIPENVPRGGTVDLVALQPADISDNEELGNVVGAVDERISQTSDYEFDGSIITTDNSGQNMLYVNSCVCLSSNCTGNHMADLERLAVDGMNAAGRIITDPANNVQNVTAFGVNVNICDTENVVYRAYLNNDDNASRNRTEPSQWQVVE